MMSASSLSLKTDSTPWGINFHFLTVIVEHSSIVTVNGLPCFLIQTVFCLWGSYSRNCRLYVQGWRGFDVNYCCCTFLNQEMEASSQGNFLLPVQTTKKLLCSLPQHSRVNPKWQGLTSLQVTNTFDAAENQAPIWPDWTWPSCKVGQFWTFEHGTRHQH